MHLLLDSDSNLNSNTPLVTIRRLLLLAILLAAGRLSAQGVEVPPPRGLVSDFAEVIDADRESSLTRLIEIVRAGSRGEIAVVTLRDIAGREVGDVALSIGREWGVGAKAPVGDRARNAGVVVLLVPRETSADGRGYITIQVGQGAEGFITDAMAGDIRREATPLLQQGAYGAALGLITARLAQRYSAEFGFALDSTLVPPRRAASTRGFNPATLLFIFVVLVIVLNVLGRRGFRGSRMIIPIILSGGRHRGWGGGWGGGGFGGGGFGGFGGGGGFSGGGSSGSF